jgi:hypothetical protein
MGSAIGEILGNAVGVAISPVPIVAVILMLLGRRAVANSLAFLAGWVVGLLGVGLIVVLLEVAGSDDGGSSVTGWVKVAIGLLFVALGVRQWTHRPRGDEEPSMPGWMASVGDVTAARSFGLAVVLAAVNPKNLGLTIAAGASIGAAGLDRGEELLVLGVYVAVASVTVATPVVLNLVLGDRARGPLDAIRSWLTAYDHVVMTVLFVVLGAKVLGDGIAVLA